MPAIHFFADEQDSKLLIDRLNADPDIAYIVADGPLTPQDAYSSRLRAAVDGQPTTIYPVAPVPDLGYRQKWKAVRSVATLNDGKLSLWHIPAGPLPLLTSHGSDAIVQNPFEGWTEECPAAEPSTPYFGPSHPAEIRLELWSRHRPYTDEDRAKLPMLVSHWDTDREVLVISGFFWSGPRRRSGRGQTQRWWNEFTSWVNENAGLIGHFEDYEDHTAKKTTTDFWAFPSSLKRLKAGVAYIANGWDLSAGIRAATTPS